MQWKRLCSAVLFAASLAMTAYGGYALFDYYQEEKQTDTLMDELAVLHSEDASEYTVGEETASEVQQDTVVDDPSAFPEITGIQNTSDLPEDTDASETAIPAESSDSPKTSAVSSHGLSALHAKNSDCIGWITIEGTAIDYPVMHKPSAKDYYLYRDFYGRHSVNGTPYIAEICNPETSDNVILYGHHMRSGKMFAALTKYKKHSFYEEHRYITFETLSGVSVYEVMYTLTTPVYTENDFEYYNFANAANAEAFNAYLSACASRALYDTGVTASYGDHLLTLCTCEYSRDNGRMLVVAKKIM